MKKSILVVLVVLSVFTLVSCATSGSSAKNGENVVVGANNDVRPDWVFKSMSTENKYSVSAYGKGSSLQTSIKKAQVEGRTLLAEYISTAVKEIVSTYINEAGTGSNTQTMEAFEAATQQKTSALLTGASQDDMWEDEEGGVWVLMSISLDSLASKLYEAASEAMQNGTFEQNEAAAEANSKMNAAIEKYFNTKPF